tara:strand:+ start:497 stop:802 length:306 start_codon:yes stop_codon:yes gene_type:complete
MGDRVSIQFVKGSEESIVLFSHWGGMIFVEEVKKYIEVLKDEVRNNEITPLDRLEPNTVMVDFVRHITKDEDRINDDLYFGKDSGEGDNSDNGHFRIEVSK